MAQVTTDHDTIRRWVESRGGCPAAVKATRSADDPGIVRIDFPGYSGQTTLEPIRWDEFFQKFDDNELALIYEEGERNGEPSRFNKIVSRKSTH